MVRKATRPDYYKGKDDDPDLGHRHIAHCIDVIRQALMCAVDISVYTWEWHKDIQRNVNMIKNPHVCRNFESIKEWAAVNTIKMYIDGGYRVMNDPLDPETWVDGYDGE